VLEVRAAGEVDVVRRDDDESQNGTPMAVVRSKDLTRPETLSRIRIMAYLRAVPLLRVVDVARSVAWYRANLGFVGNPFPAEAPHEFAMLQHGSAELMVRRGVPPVRASPSAYDWDVYLRCELPRFRELFAALSARGIVSRRLERMFYGLVEFEITDPDGYTICLSQAMEDASDLPTPAV